LLALTLLAYSPEHEGIYLNFIERETAGPWTGGGDLRHLPPPRPRPRRLSPGWCVAGNIRWSVSLCAGAARRCLGR